MHVDASAVVAILLEEPDFKAVLTKLLAAPDAKIPVVTAVEAALSLGRNLRNYQLAAEAVSGFLHDASVRVIDVPADIFDDVLLAYSRYGKGTGSSAKLNFGDCFCYAMTKRAGDKLLFKGNDFSQTDITPVN